MKAHITTLFTCLPTCPGVYLFKDRNGAVLYIGKAKHLKKRVKQYQQNYGKDWKATALLDASTQVECIQTASELEAMLLEARLIQSYQPAFNVLLKTGQPYTYFVITDEAVPQFLLVRIKQLKGTYFGPFIEKMAARRAYRFLQEAFQLFLCRKNIAGGCLAYHMKRCAGACRPDFDIAAYRDRLSLACRALRSQRERDALIRQFDEQIAHANTHRAFERSARLVAYKTAIARMHESLATQFNKPQSLRRLAHKDIWVWQPGVGAFGILFLFCEKDGVLTRRRIFCFSSAQADEVVVREHIESYYRLFAPAQQVFCSESLHDPGLFAQFLMKWHALPHAVSVTAPFPSTPHDVLTLASVYAQQEVEKRQRHGGDLKRLLRLPCVPCAIDCFDISHKQGHAMVGSCVRFVNGQPATAFFRHFHVRTIIGQNDYAALQEIVLRRYEHVSDLPNLIVIDGGKGQLSAVREVLEEMFPGTQRMLISLAKREETVFSDQFPEGKVLNQKSVPAQLLIALRDYAHHFAVSFHRKQKIG